MPSYWQKSTNSSWKEYREFFQYISMIKANPKGKAIFLFKEWSSKIYMECHFNWHVQGTREDNNKAQAPSSIATRLHKFVFKCKQYHNKAIPNATRWKIITNGKALVSFQMQQIITNACFYRYAPSLKLQNHNEGSKH